MFLELCLDWAKLAEHFIKTCFTEYLETYNLGNREINYHEKFPCTLVYLAENLMARRVDTGCLFLNVKNQHIRSQGVYKGNKR